MKERQILFKGAMVNAILACTKTQTRRTDRYMLQYPPAAKPDVGLLSKSKHGESLLAATWDATNGKFTASFCPYGKPGDQLWVREAIRLIPDQDPDDGTNQVFSEYAADGSVTPADAWPCMAEGVMLGEDRSHSHAELGIEYRPYRDAYAALWESINGPGSWDANPWVWCISFKVVKP